MIVQGKSLLKGLFRLRGRLRHSLNDRIYSKAAPTTEWYLTHLDELEERLEMSLSKTKKERP